MEDNDGEIHHGSGFVLLHVSERDRDRDRLFDDDDDDDVQSISSCFALLAGS
jgi:hypothetical protein